MSTKYGRPESVTTDGGLEYRLRFPEPDWEISERTTRDIAALWLQFDEWGRKRNPKKSRMREIIQEWNTTDAYCAIKASLQSRCEHPGIAFGVEKNALYDALGSVFGDGSRKSGKKFQREHGTTTKGLRKAQPDCPDATGPMPLNDLYGHYLYELAEASSTTKQASILEEMLRNCDEPWVIAELVLKSMSLYWGTSAMVKVINSEFDLDNGWKRRRVAGSTVSHFLYAATGESRDDLQPHDRHGTMKANTTSASKVAKKTQEDWLAQYKYDGARLFIHHAGDGDVRAYSGGHKDVTAALPELDDIDWPDCAFIFDCEATPYDEDGNVVPFENIMTRLTRVGKVDADKFDTDVVFKIFDCPVWHGKDICERKYTSRFEIVKRIFHPDNVARTGEDLETTFHRSVEDQHEGLVIKTKDGAYIPGGRHPHWLKWKPEPETLEVEVLAVIRGSGKHSDRMGALKVGLNHEGTTIPCGRVGTGFSDKERKEWWIRYETGEAMGQVVEIEYEDIQQTGKSWGLRFPRYKHLRPDGDVDTVERAARLIGRDDDYKEWV